MLTCCFAAPDQVSNLTVEQNGVNSTHAVNLMWQTPDGRGDVINVSATRMPCGRLSLNLGGCV